MHRKGDSVMNEYGKMVHNFSLEGKVLPYEKELIENLRDKYYDSVPLSIALNSGFFCNHACHCMALQLTRGMKKFRILRGNINLFPFEPDGNHSWVELDEWVYDTSDGFKWDKNTYYQVFNPILIYEYDENNYLESWFYRKELEASPSMPDEHTAINIEFLELAELERKTFNHSRLMAEIDLYRKKEGITEKMSKEDRIKCKKIILEELEK